MAAVVLILALLGLAIGVAGTALPLGVLVAVARVILVGVGARHGKVLGGYGVVTAAYLWDALGSALHAPQWTL